MSQAVLVTPQNKILLDALTALLQVPQATVIQRALVVYRDSLSREDQAAIEAFCGRALQRREDLISKAAKQTPGAGQPKAIYESSRFCFKRDVIEKLDSDQEFRMITPVGVFQMSKADFYREFPNVVASESYKRGVYNYPRLPSRGEAFRV